MKSFGKIALSFAAIGAAASLSAPASAATILGLYNTGVDNAGKVLAPGVAEQHYVITAETSPLYVAPIVPKVTTYNQWSANSAVGSAGSSWITQKINADNTPARSGSFGVAQYFEYTLLFNLGTLSPSSAMITGDLQADNYAEVFLNGNLVGGQTPVPSPGVTNYFRKFTAFGANAGFVNGVNTLTFRVTDYGVVSGLRVANLVGTAVPEPATWAMMMIGFGGVATMARRRRSKGTSVLA